MKAFTFIGVCVLCAALGVMAGHQRGFLTGKDTASREWQKTTVERGLAIYCPSNGKWAWLGECKQ